MSPIKKYTTIILISVIPLFSQVNLSASAEMDYDSQLSRETAVGFTISTSYNLNKKSKLALGYHGNRFSQSIQTPSKLQLIPFSVHTVKLSFSYLLVENFYSLDIRPLVSIGNKHIRRGSYRANLGALGEKIISETSDSFFSASYGLIISKNIYKQFSFFIRPEISVYDFENYYRVLSIAGGIDVNLF